MNFREFIGRLLTHTAAATAWLVLVLLIVERLAPGSILPYFNIYWLVLVLILLFMMTPRTRD